MSPIAGRTSDPGTGFAPLVIGSTISAAFGFVTLAVAGRLLGADGYASFAILWGAFFIAAGILSGLQQETTRSMSKRLDGHRPGARPIFASLLAGALAAGSIVGTAWAWVPEDLASGSWLSIGLTLGCGVVWLTVYVTVCGALAAHGRWTSLGLIVGIEAATRLLAAVVLFPIATTASAQALAVASGPAIVIALMCWRRVRSLTFGRGSNSFGGMLHRTFLTSGVTACSAMLTSGFPVLVSLGAHPAMDARAGPLFAAVMVTRAPIMITVNGVRLRLIAWFLTPPVDHRRPSRFALVSLLAATAYVAAAGLLGPAALTFTFGSAFTVSPFTMAGLAFSALLTGCLTVTGVALVAYDAQRSALLGWLSAVVCAMAIFASVPDLQLLTLLGLTVAPAVGLVVHLVSLRRRARLLSARIP